MPEIRYVNFGNSAAARAAQARVATIFNDMSRTAAGRTILSRLPRTLTITLVSDTPQSRYRSNSLPAGDEINFGANDISGDIFSAYNTILHEIVHQLQYPISFGVDANQLASGLIEPLTRNRSDPAFTYVTDPLRGIQNTETLTQDLTNLLWKLMYGMVSNVNYYIPIDVPQTGTLRSSPLSVQERSTLESAIKRLQDTSASISGNLNKNNYLKVEEAYRRAIEAGYIERPGKGASVRNLLNSFREILKLKGGLSFRGASLSDARLASLIQRDVQKGWRE